MASDIARNLREEPSLLQITVAYHVLCAATNVQLAAMYGPPGTGKTRLLIWLTTLFLTAAE